MGDNPSSRGVSNNLLARTFQERITVPTDSSLSVPQKAGSIIFDARLGAFYVSTGAAWVPISGAAAAESLSATLVAGNTTGGTSIEVSGPDSIHGEDAVTGLSLTLRGGDGSAGVGGPASLTGGSGTTGMGGVIIATPSVLGAVPSGDITISGGGNDGTDSGGGVAISGGDNIGTGLGGRIVLVGGDSSDSGAASGHVHLVAGDNTDAAGGPVGDIIFEAGDSPGGGVGGNIVLLTGTSAGVPGSVMLGDPAGQTSHLVSRQTVPPVVAGPALISPMSTDNAGFISGVPAGGGVTSLTFGTSFPAGSEVFVTLTQIGPPTVPGLVPHLTAPPTVTGFSVTNPDPGAPALVQYSVHGGV